MAGSGQKARSVRFLNHLCSLASLSEILYKKSNYSIYLIRAHHCATRHRQPPQSPASNLKKLNRGTCFLQKLIWKSSLLNSVCALPWVGVRWLSYPYIEIKKPYKGFLQQTPSQHTAYTDKCDVAVATRSLKGAGSSCCCHIVEVCTCSHPVVFRTLGPCTVMLYKCLACAYLC